MDKEYFEIFITESKEHLNCLNNALLLLEADTSNNEALNEIFRSMHTMKGMAKSLGFDKIGMLTHDCEYLLDDIRNDNRGVDTSLVDTLFMTFDLLEELVEKVSKVGKDEGEISEVLKKLREHREGDGERSKKSKGKKPREVEKEEAVPEDVESNQEIENLRGSLNKKEKGSIKEDKGSKGVGSHSVHVNIERLDSILNLVGEIIINKSRLDEISKVYNNPELIETLSRNEHLTNELQYEVMQIRMVPVEQIFSRFPRMVRDLAKEQGKEIDFSIEGGEIELDRGVLDKIIEPMVHVLRNSVDHAIESPSEREKKGKPRKGVLKVIAARKKETVVINVEDDGRGIDTEKIKTAAVKKGLLSEEEASKLGKRESLELVFKPGFSTIEEVTNISGRGVGMDIIKSKIEALGGVVNVESEPDKGTKVVMELPLTLAIIKALLVEIDKATYAFPLANVNRIIDVSQKDIKSVNNQKVINLDDEIIPIITNLFNSKIEPEEDRGFKLLIIERGLKKAALRVARVISQEEIVIKSLGSQLEKIDGFAGATILGDGRVALILDTASILE